MLQGKRVLTEEKTQNQRCEVKKLITKTTKIRWLVWSLELLNFFYIHIFSEQSFHGTLKERQTRREGNELSVKQWSGLQCWDLAWPSYVYQCWRTHTYVAELLKTISVMPLSHEHCSQYPYFHGSPFSMEYHKEWMSLEHCLYTSSIKGIFNKLLHIRIRISSPTFQWRQLKPNSNWSAHRSRKWSTVVYS